jgi:hypothetical protein
MSGFFSILITAAILTVLLPVLVSVIFALGPVRLLIVLGVAYVVSLLR